MEYVTLFFVLKRLEEVKNKLASVNDTERSRNVRDLQVSMLNDKIIDLKEGNNPKNSLNREEKESLLKDSCTISKACPNYFNVIKSLRDRTGMGLREAKAIVDGFRQENFIR